MTQLENIKEKYSLFDHQVTGAQFLVDVKKGILGDEMGTGKTRQTIVACHYASDKGNLIVCPASLKINWQREINMVFPDDEVFVVESGMKDEDIPDGEKWYVINYDILKKHKERLLELIQNDFIDIMALDEVHYIKGKSQRADATLEIAYGMRYVFALTGTLILNRPIELFNPLRALGHPLAIESGKSYSTMRRNFGIRYCGAFLRSFYGGRRFWDETGATNLKELKDKMKEVILRRKKEDVLDLPPKLISIMDHKLTPNQQGMYEQAWDDYVKFVKGEISELSEIEQHERLGKILVAEHIIEINKLKQICSLAKVDRIVADAKNAIEQGEKIIIFSQYTETIKRILEGLRKKQQVKAVRITGADNMNERQVAIDAMENDDKTKVIVANIKAGGVGLNITSANIVMFADMDWSPEVHSQAEDRAHRQGQKKTVSVYYYVAQGTIDEDIIEMLTEKKQIIQQIMDGKKKSVKTTGMREDFINRMASKMSTVNSRQ